MTTPRRRWLRLAYSLRMLFVVVTLACPIAAWSSYSLDWIRQRQEATKSGRIARCHDPSEPHKFVVAPGLLWLFGERGVKYLVARGKLEEGEFSNLQRLFPEAEIESIPVPYPPVSATH